MGEWVLSQGEKLGDCTIRDRIGKGGFAQVYLADCKWLGNVALKLYTDPSLDYRDFFQEVLAMGLFGHKPYFVRFLGASGISSHHQYILMEYMKGGDLRERIRRGISSDEAVHIVISIAFALRDMHAMRIVHRDVSLANVFFDESGQARLGDLGFAATPEQIRRTVFKKYYTAPEVMEGGDYSTKSDIYSLGVILLEMLQKGSKLESLLESTKSFEPPEHMKGAKGLVEEMCEPEPDNRPSADEVITELARIASCASVAITTTLWGEKRSIKVPIYFEEEQNRRFQERWAEKEGEVFHGLQEDLQTIFSTALYLSLTPIPFQKRGPNYYLGVEHVIWTLLERDSLLFSILSKKGLSPQEIREEILNYFEDIKSRSTVVILSPRLEEILSKAKRRFPGGVGEVQFVRQILDEETYFSYILKTRGIRAEEIKREMEEEKKEIET